MIGITMGDVNGVGPEILAKALTRASLWSLCRPVVIGSASVLEDARRWVESAPTPVEIDGPEEGPNSTIAVGVIDAGQRAPLPIPGTLSAVAGRCAMEWLIHAVHLAQEGRLDAIVTCPINKEGIHLAGYKFLGHTDAIAEMTGSPDYRMCLFSDRMRIVHVSAHCPLSEAIAMVTQERVERSIRVAHQALSRLELPRRRIAVAGLNPHAGEAGILGKEEATIISPVVERCASEGIDCSGPYPPDTVFRRMWEGEFDLVVAMYHDQGHIALKLVAMDEGVNVTLGIPIVRTSVDHGTAYDIAGQGIAREASLVEAIRLAARLAG